MVELGFWSGSIYATRQQLQRDSSRCRQDYSITQTTVDITNLILGNRMRVGAIPTAYVSLAI